MLFPIIRKSRNFLPAGIAVLVTIFLVFSFRSAFVPFFPHIAAQPDSAPLEPPPIAAEPSGVPKSASSYTLPFTFSRGHLISPKIWQILFPIPGRSTDTSLDRKNLEDTSSWLALNPGYGYILVSQREADHFIDTHFSGDARILKVWRAIKNPGVKSDLLRYLMLFIEGGVYTDIDTEALKPIDAWVPKKFRDQAKVIIGIEWDQLDGGPWAEIPHRLQFCQWTIAAAPGHPLFMKMAYHTIDALEALATEHGTSLDRLELSSVEVMMSSGPASWTDVVLEQLMEIDSSITDVTDFSGMKPTGPRLYGDILILTIDGFGMGQTHSASTHDGSIPDAALLKHKFRGSWRGSL